MLLAEGGDNCTNVAGTETLPGFSLQASWAHGGKFNVGLKVSSPCVTSVIKIPLTITINSGTQFQRFQLRGQARGHPITLVMLASPCFHPITLSLFPLENQSKMTHCTTMVVVSCAAGLTFISFHFIVTPVAPVHNCNWACLFSAPLCTALQTAAAG